MDEAVRGRGGRGFASMSAERQREIARKGGKAAHARGKAHEFTREEAREAGRKGGERVSANRSHMAAIGRIGGQRSSRKATVEVLNSAGAQIEGAADSANIQGEPN